ncbi:MAG: hypothetical protein OCD76_02340 [Reichenbachiella sp.]
MKVRIQENYIRLRLSQSEVEVFGKTGEVKSEIAIGANSLVYQLIAFNNVKELEGDYSQDRITIKMPADHQKVWTETDKVGYETIAGDLKIVVEKDFKCIHRRSAIDDEDSFPNPSANNNFKTG